jgi:hypothetical protein
MTFMNLKKRIGRLEMFLTNSHRGGVVIELKKGGYEHSGKKFERLKDIPGNGFLIVPERVTVEEWERAAIIQQRKLLKEVGLL